MIDGVKVKDLKVIPDERGLLMEMWRSDDPDFERFGQVYVTMVYPGRGQGVALPQEADRPLRVRLAGWPRSSCTTTREDSPTHGETNEFVIGWQRQRLVIIPPGVYHGFTAVGTEPACIVNIPTELYDYDDPDEYRLPFDDPAIGYDWGVKSG